MNSIADVLASLGAHMVWIVIACVEVIVAVVLLGLTLFTREKKNKGVAFKGELDAFLHEYNHQKEEAGIFLRRKDMYPLYAVGDLEGMLGITLEQLQEDVGRLSRLMKDASEGRRFWKQYHEWDGSGDFTFEFELTEGEWIRTVIRRSDDLSHDLIRFMNHTKFHQLTKEYERRLSVVEEESHSKTSFLSRMSHEIRTPMNGIIGMLTLAEGKLDADHPAMQYLSKADELSDHLLALLNDILDMSRIEAGKVELEEKPFSLRTLGDRLYDMFAKNLDARGIHYEVAFEDMTKDVVIGDELRISQVIINFLSNAVKFTSEGEITVTFRQMLLKDGKMDLMVRVRDTGIGMTADFINRIFRPFEQESIETAKTYGGTGLGMAITDQLVRLMGGEIVVDSRVGKGSEFSVFLHLPIAEEAADGMTIEGKADDSEEWEENIFEGRRILMAEDNEINAMIAVEILNEMGAEVEVADNGQKAVDAFAAHPAGYYDFILMDVQMPVLDGRSAARKIRSLDRADAKDILIFALSADAFVEDERLSKESGMNGHYAKPLNFTELRHNVGAFLHERK